MATLATDTFTGTNGATPAQWARATTGGGNFTVQSNRGRMAVTGTGYTNVRYYWSTLGKVADSKVYYEITLSTITEQTIWVSIRDTGDNQFWPSGLYIRIQPSLGNYESGAAYGTEGYQKATTPLTMTAGMTLGVELQAIGSAIKSRVWNLAGTKPTAWDREWTNTDNLTAGYATLGSWSGQSTNPTYDVDNASATDGATGAVTGSVTLTGSGTLTATAAPKANATQAYTGPGALTFTSAVNTAGNVAVSGAGTLTMSGAAASSGSMTLSGSGQVGSAGTPAIANTLSTTGTGSLSASGQAAIDTALPLGGSGALSVLGAASSNGQVELASNGALDTAGNPTVRGDLASIGAGVLELAGTPRTNGAVNVNGSGALTYSSNGSASGSLTLASSGALTVTGVVSVPGALILGSTGSISNTAQLSVAASLALTGAGVLTPGQKHEQAISYVTARLMPRTNAATLSIQPHSATVTRTWKASIDANHPS